jgi:hypothetical protein
MSTLSPPGTPDRRPREAHRFEAGMDFFTFVRPIGPANLSLRKRPQARDLPGFFPTSNASCLITQNRQGQPVVITSLSAADLRLGLLELCLAQLNDGT